LHKGTDRKNPIAKGQGRFSAAESQKEPSSEGKNGGHPRKKELAKKKATNPNDRIRERDKADAIERERNKKKGTRTRPTRGERWSLNCVRMSGPYEEEIFKEKRGHSIAHREKQMGECIGKNTPGGEGGVRSGAKNPVRRKGEGGKRKSCPRAKYAKRALERKNLRKKSLHITRGKRKTGGGGRNITWERI